MRQMTNDVSIGQLYPRQGSTQGLKSGASTDEQQTVQGVVPADKVTPQAPIPTMITFVILLVLLMLIAQRLGAADDFSNIRASFYNVVVIGLSAAIFIPLLKLFAVKVPSPASGFILSI